MPQYPSTSLVWIVLLPLLGAAINGLFGRRLPKRVTHVIACAAIGGAFLVALSVFADLRMIVPGKRVLTQTLFTWIGIPGLGVSAKLLVDPLSMVMTLIITGVGFLIHVYSSEYMDHDEAGHRYFAYLNLFVFSMLLLVLGANLPMMFVGWEGVGLCSYLLIGFWFKDEANAVAGRKAFLTNRVGDLGFLLGMFVIFAALGTFEFQEITQKLAIDRWPIPTWVVTTASLLLFVGATGKSAQIPLYIWLPDAMAGPTPVSALIHAATMVTAGVYMIARLYALYLLAPVTMGVVAGIGAATALMAATIAITQNDIKKVLAYSTVSQLGFMFMGVGVGAFIAGIFHLMTHAFFKALLFLGSGSVIHGMDHAHGADDPQDVRTMGGLKGAMPVTFWTFAVATLAIAGIPPFAGFFSKDEILWRALSSEYGATWVWVVGSIAATLTAFYMTRLVILTFLGSYRGREGTLHHVHDPGWRMAAPLVILAVLSALGGFLGVPHVLHHVLHLPNILEHWLEPVFSYMPVRAMREVPLAGGRLGELGAMGVSVALATAGIAAAAFLYVVRPDLPALVARRLRPAYQLLLNKYYVDEILAAVLYRPLHAFSRIALFEGLDRRFIDLLVEGSGRAVRGMGSVLRLTQTGNVGTYLAYLAVGTLALIVALSRP